MRRLFLPILLLPALAHAQEGARPLADEEKPAQKAAPQLTKAPKLTKFVDAPYPEAAKETQREAAVELVLTLDAEGNVTEVVLAGDPEGFGFDEAAIEAAKRFEFEPAEIDGVPAAIRVPFVYRFAYTPPAPPPAAEVEKETGRIVGRVREKGTGLPVAGAPVAIVALGREELADGNGVFALADLEPGAYEVAATSPDHRTRRLQVELAANEEVRIDFLLERLRTSPFETIVRGEREQTSLTRRTLGQEELRSVPGTFGDPLRAVLNLPGLARPPYVIGVLLVRGTGPGDSAVFIDGHEVPLLFHFLGGPSILPPEMLARVDLFPGNFTVRYGRAIGGIIDVETRRPEPERWQGSVDIDIFDVGGYFEGPIGDQSAVSGAVRRSYIDAVIRGVDAATDDDIATVLPVYYDYQARFDHRFDPRNAMSVLVFGSEDELTLVGGVPGQEQGDTNARIGFHRLKTDWKANPQKGLEWVVSPVVGVDITTFDAGEAEIDSTILEYAFRWDVRIEPAEDLILRTGLDFLGRYVTLDGSIPLVLPEYRAYPGTNPGDRETTELSRSLFLNTVALYLEAEWRPAGGPVTLIPGVRTDYYRYVGENRFFVDPRMNARWQIDEQWALKAGAGIFSQSPTEWRLDPEFGNPDLGLEWAEHYGLGVEYQVTEAISIELDGFFARRHDLTEPAEDAEGDGSVEDFDVPRFDNSGRGRSYGMELLVRHEVTKAFYGWVAYTLSRAEEVEPDSDGYELVIWDQTHILTLVASYRWGDGWETGLRFRLASGNLTTPIVGATFDGDRGNYQAVEGAENSRRQPLFNQLDLRVEKTWTFTAWKLGVYLDIQNVYFAENPEFTAFDYRFRDADPVPGIPVLPSFGLRARF